jgi:4-amino-4-deoxychorismate lyase
MYPLFESIRIEKGLIQNKGYHEARMRKSLKHLYGISLNPDLNTLIQIPETYKKGIIKCKISYKDTEHSVGFFTYKPKIIRSIKLVTDDHIKYAYKYSDRSSLEYLLQKKEDCDEIIIVKHNMLSDTSYSNLALYDGHGWFTPKYPLLAGVRRASLLEKGIIQERVIKPEDLKHYEGLKLINAMMGLEDQDLISVSAVVY